MGYINFDPFRTVEQFAKKIQHIANDVEKGYDIEFGNGFSPRVDIVEDSKKVMLTFELPGIKKDDVKITINEENVITVKGKKVKEVSDGEAGNKNYFRYERKFGEFSRGFALPENINKEKIIAKFENGILSIELDKIEPEKPKEIEISVS